MGVSADSFELNHILSVGRPELDIGRHGGADLLCFGGWGDGAGVELPYLVSPTFRPARPRSCHRYSLSDITSPLLN